jgi:hypothetical protein
MSEHGKAVSAGRSGREASIKAFNTLRITSVLNGRDLKVSSVLPENNEGRWSAQAQGRPAKKKK